MRPEDRRLLFAMAGVLFVVFALVGSNVAANHAPKPHDVPAGIVGSPQVVSSVSRALERRAPGALQIHRYPSVAAGRTAVLHREVYGTLVVGPTPLLLVASAASPTVAGLLEQASAVARQHGRKVVVRDLVPLPPSDSRGATAFSTVLGLLIAGIMGSTAIFLLGHHRPPPVRAAAMLTLGTCAGLVAAFATNVVVAAFPTNFLGVWGVCALYVLALGLPIIAFQVMVGAAGTAIGAVMFLVIGNPASGGSSAPELLPGFWRALSQILPPGAATTALRDVVYFHGHGAGHALLVLVLWAVLGIAVALTVNTLRARTRA